MSYKIDLRFTSGTMRVGEPHGAGAPLPITKRPMKTQKLDQIGLNWTMGPWGLGSGARMPHAKDAEVAKGAGRLQFGLDGVLPHRCWQLTEVLADSHWGTAGKNSD